MKIDFTMKAEWVKEIHRTTDPESSIYSGVVSRESIRILLAHADMNGVTVVVADMQNDYL